MKRYMDDAESVEWDPPIRTAQHAAVIRMLGIDKPPSIGLYGSSLHPTLIIQEAAQWQPKGQLHLLQTLVVSRPTTRAKEKKQVA